MVFRWFFFIAAIRLHRKAHDREKHAEPYYRGLCWVSPVVDVLFLVRIVAALEGEEGP